jgi:hypothetical protein
LCRENGERAADLVFLGVVAERLADVGGAALRLQRLVPDALAGNAGLAPHTRQTDTSKDTVAGDAGLGPHTRQTDMAKDALAGDAGLAPHTRQTDTAKDALAGDADLGHR